MGYLSLVSTACMLSGATALVAASSKLEKWAEPDWTGQALIDWHNIPRSVGIIVFCFAGHPCFPAISTRMSSPPSWNFCIDISFLCAAVYYGAFGYLGFIVFG